MTPLAHDGGMDEQTPHHTPFGAGEPEPGDWTCPVCATPTPHEFRAGRKRIYCTNACRQKAYRWRRAHGVRLLATPWRPAQRSVNRRAHAVRPAADFVGQAPDQLGRHASICGAFARVTAPVAGWHNEFVPGGSTACRACTRLLGADPAWIRDYPVVGPDTRGYLTVYRPPDQRYADYRARSRTAA